LLSAKDEEPRPQYRDIHPNRDGSATTIGASPADRGRQVPIARKAEQFQKPILTFLQSIVIFLALAILTADIIAMLFLFGRFTFWESAVIFATVLALAAGMIYTIRSICHKHESQ
jgi:hypothetical protein